MSARPIPSPRAVIAALLVLVSSVAGAASEEGVASWYGPSFHGKRTSNGEVYDQEKLTAAHRTIAFGTYLRVLNLDNGSSVVVRVNDRGPFAKNRVLDLSAAAARILGMLPTGTARISFDPIPEEEALAWKGGPVPGVAGAESPPRPVLVVKAGERYRIQVASYREEANARATVERLKASGLEAGIERSAGRARVVFPDLSPEEARSVAARLDLLGYRGIAVTARRPLN